jgi:hypothetical protein
MKIISGLGTAVLIIGYIALPIWVALQAWRKGFRIFAVILGISFLVPFLPVALSVFSWFWIKPFKPNWDYVPSPRVFAGCGTKFMGADCRDADGSFITTLWFCFFYIPFIPIQSYRVVYSGGNTLNQGAVITSVCYYEIVDKLRFHKKQIVQAYGLVFSFIVIFLLAGALLYSSPGGESMFTGISVFIIIVYLIIGYKILKAK